MRSNTRRAGRSRRAASLVAIAGLLAASTTSGAASAATERPDPPDLDEACAGTGGGFGDVPGDSAHADAVRCLRDLGVARGFGDGSYRPRTAVTRDQMATFLVNTVEQVRPLPAVAAPFGDVAGSVHAGAVGKLAASGIARGRDATTFAPREAVTRDQMASFVTRAIAYAVTGDAAAVGDLPAGRTVAFADVTDGPHAAAITALAGWGVVSGYGDGTFRPRQPVLRDQMATFLVGGLGVVAVATPPVTPPVVPPPVEPPEPPVELPPVRILADVDRDGALTDADLDGRDAWTEDRGAIMLPNLDDHAERCDVVDADGAPLTDDELVLCFDAADDAVNGPEDVADLAPLRVEPIADLGAGATGTLTVSAPDRVNVFVADGTDWSSVGDGASFDAAALAAGIDLRVEATDIVRDVEAWDGFVSLEVAVVDGGTTVGADEVVLRVAPLLFVNNTMPLERLIIAAHAPQPQARGFAALSATAEDVERDILGDPVEEAVAALDGDAPTGDLPSGPGEGRVGPAAAAAEADGTDTSAWPNGFADFRADLRDGLDALGVTADFIELDTGTDKWIQDMFEPAYLSMPAAGGGEHRMRVYVRTANQSRSGFREGRPLREGGRALFDQLRGPGVAVVQQYDPALLPDDGSSRQPHDTFNSGGNFEAAPPFVHPDGREFPAGRMFYGARPPFAADATFLTMLEAQGYQDPIAVDTSFLRVGHVDEFTTFLPADNDRGWVLGVADARLGTQLLQDMVDDGYGDERLVNDVEELGGRVALGDLTVQQALFHPELRLGQLQGAAGVDAALAVLTAELGLTEDEIVRLPALFRDPGTTTGGGTRTGLYAYLPGVANGISTGTGGFLSPKQHGPQRDGVDVFQQATEEILATIDTEVAWVEDWVYAHQGTGEIHCVTNAQRDLTVSEPWWGQSEARTLG